MIQDFYYLWLTFLLSFFPQLAQFYFSRYIKKTQKTPKEELERAKQYRAEYLSRKERDLP